MKEFRHVLHSSQFDYDIIDNFEDFVKVRFICSPFLYCEVEFMAGAANEWIST